jgi:hypothetical protein
MSMGAGRPKLRTCVVISANAWCPSQQVYFGNGKVTVDPQQLSTTVEIGARVDCGNSLNSASLVASVRFRCYLIH